MEKIHKNWIITVSACLLLFLGIFLWSKYLYAPKENYPEVVYNNFVFKKVTGLWYFEWQGDDKLYNIPLRYNPEEVEDVYGEGRLTNSFNQKEVYIAFDPLANESEFKYLALAASELTLSFGSAFGKEVIAACTRNQTAACEERPIADCSHDDKAVIVIKANGDTGVFLKDNCAVLQGEGFELLRAVDRFLYALYGVIK